MKMKIVNEIENKNKNKTSINNNNNNENKNGNVVVMDKNVLILKYMVLTNVDIYNNETSLKDNIYIVCQDYYACSGLYVDAQMSNSARLQCTSYYSCISLTDLTEIEIIIITSVIGLFPPLLFRWLFTHYQPNRQKQSPLNQDSNDKHRETLSNMGISNQLSEKLLLNEGINGTDENENNNDNNKQNIVDDLMPQVHLDKKYDDIEMVPQPGLGAQNNNDDNDDIEDLSENNANNRNHNQNIELANINTPMQEENSDDDLPLPEKITNGNTLGDTNDEKMGETDSEDEKDYNKPFNTADVTDGETTSIGENENENKISINNNNNNNKFIKFNIII